MADFTPPSGPPPPKVPEGWKAVWNDQYKEWFYVNLYTKKSVWEKPTEPAKPDDGTSPDGPPPSYSTGSGQSAPTRDVKSNNPYQDALNRDQTGTESDEALARRLQEEENRRASASPRAADRGQADSYYNSGPDSSIPNQYGGQQYPTSPGGPPPGVAGGSTGSRGFLSSLKNKFGGGGGSSGGLGGFGPPRPGYGGPPGPGYGYPQQGYPPQGYGGYGPPQGYGQPMYAQQPPRKSGLGTGGALALGAGGGLLGGMLLEDAIQGHDQNEYQQGYDQGYNQGDDGGDFGGGDGGGDFGGGDF